MHYLCLSRGRSWVTGTLSTTKITKTCEWKCSRSISMPRIPDFYLLHNKVYTLYLRILENSYSCFSNRFASFYETATADAVLGYLIAFLVLLATIKLWHLLRLNPKLHMITSTLQRAWTDISGFIVVMTIMFLAYSIAVSMEMFFYKY